MRLFETFEFMRALWHDSLGTNLNWILLVSFQHRLFAANIYARAQWKCANRRKSQRTIDFDLLEMYLSLFFICSLWSSNLVWATSDFGTLHRLPDSANMVSLCCVYVLANPFRFYKRHTDERMPEIIIGCIQALNHILSIQNKLQASIKCIGGRRRKIKNAVKNT